MGQNQWDISLSKTGLFTLIMRMPSNQSSSQARFVTDSQQFQWIAGVVQYTDGTTERKVIVQGMLRCVQSRFWWCAHQEHGEVLEIILVSNCACNSSSSYNITAPHTLSYVLVSHPERCMHFHRVTYADTDPHSYEVKVEKSENEI